MDQNQKKYVGKTPGRERKPLTVKKQPVKQINCKTSLQFGSPVIRPQNLNNLPISPTNSWTSNATFSDVVAHSPTEAKASKTKPMFDNFSSSVNNGFNLPASNYMDNILSNVINFNSMQNVRRPMNTEQPLSNLENL